MSFKIVAARDALVVASCSNALRDLHVNLLAAAVTPPPPPPPPHLRLITTTLNIIE